MPDAWDLGYHAREPQYEGQMQMSDECEYIGGPCYYDGSSLNGKPHVATFLAKGPSAIWEMLREEYNYRFGEANND